jgi:3-methylcrotonyl-CoA carboxylase alpha subunit
MNTIKRLLIANRGEIACRVIRTCKRMGIESVAVFSDPDSGAQHVRQADFACRIGGAPANDSYLNARAIVDAALKIEAQAVHPGYGFLSESTELISLCDANGLIFVGPTHDNIAAMASKIESKATARSLGIPTIPGYDGDDRDDARLVQEAAAIGFPVLIKSSSGGGGKGMRFVNDADDFESALNLARRESLAAFGDDRVLLEQYVTRPRHIEVQVLCDEAGNVVHLFERECSIQRYYQKLIEEAPAAHLDATLRQQLFDWALRLAGHLHYRGAGTVEFIVDADSRAAYFLEMNTRLQVEHPTTEMVTGIDLVEWQIRIAQGEVLPFRQQNLVIDGHAIEARINAEDPANAYRPETGKIRLYRQPEGNGVRIDSGIDLGSKIGPYYDSLLAKVIAHGETRGQASQRLLRALNDFAIGGVKTNQAFLASLITRPAFHRELDTRYIERLFPSGWQPWGEDLHQAIAAAALAETRRHDPNAPFANTPWQSLAHWRLTASAGVVACSSFWLDDGGELIEVRIGRDEERYRIVIGDDTHEVALYPPDGTPEAAWQVDVEGTRTSLDIALDGNTVSLRSPRLGRSYRFLTLEESQLGRGGANGNAGNEVRAPLPGLITDVLVSVGDRVAAGSTAVVMEAMKLIHNLVCPISGTVKDVLCATGDSVATGSLLVTLEPEAHADL